jgi:hypothetical protein
MRFQSSVIYQHQHILHKFANLLICQFAKWQTVNPLDLEGFEIEFQVYTTLEAPQKFCPNKFKK